MAAIPSVPSIPCVGGLGVRKLATPSGNGLLNGLMAYYPMLSEAAAVGPGPLDNPSGATFSASGGPVTVEGYAIFAGDVLLGAYDEEAFVLGNQDWMVMMWQKKADGPYLAFRHDASLRMDMGAYTGFGLYAELEGGAGGVIQQLSYDDTAWQNLIYAYTTGDSSGRLWINGVLIDTVETDPTTGDEEQFYVGGDAFTGPLTWSGPVAKWSGTIPNSPTQIALLAAGTPFASFTA